VISGLRSVANLVALTAIVLSGCASTKNDTGQQAVEGPDLPQIMEVKDLFIPPLFTGIGKVDVRSETVTMVGYYDTVLEECGRYPTFGELIGIPTARKRCAPPPSVQKSLPKIANDIDPELARLLRDPKAGPVVTRFISGMAPPATLRKFTGALFSFDSAELRESDKSVIRKALADFGLSDVSRVLVVAHTDSIGSAAYNQGLSERRADSVAGFLKEEGVKPNVLFQAGAGERIPVASNATAEGRTKNRRARIFVYLLKPEGAKP
jgi:outer membrane protein OmpA-like peptidoglycan-associated protein